MTQVHVQSKVYPDGGKLLARTRFRMPKNCILPVMVAAVMAAVHGCGNTPFSNGLTEQESNDMVRIFHLEHRNGTKLSAGYSAL
jgi:hypothetical protein